MLKMINELLTEAMIKPKGMFVWKDIPGYEGIYQISSHGEIRKILIKELNPSVDSIVLTSNTKDRINISVKKIMRAAFMPQYIMQGEERWAQVPFPEFASYEVSNYERIRVNKKKVLFPDEKGWIVFTKVIGGKRRREYLSVIRIYLNCFPYDPTIVVSKEQINQVFTE